VRERYENELPSHIFLSQVCRTCWLFFPIELEIEAVVTILAQWSGVFAVSRCCFETALGSPFIFPPPLLLAIN
jgi:hypothetical protein